jgi:hypothetical protein
MECTNPRAVVELVIQGRVQFTGDVRTLHSRHKAQGRQKIWTFYGCYRLWQMQSPLQQELRIQASRLSDGFHTALTVATVMTQVLRDDNA